MSFFLLASEMPFRTQLWTFLQAWEYEESVQEGLVGENVGEEVATCAPV